MLRAPSASGRPLPALSCLNALNAEAENSIRRARAVCNKHGRHDRQGQRAVTHRVNHSPSHSAARAAAPAATSGTAAALRLPLLVPGVSAVITRIWAFMPAEQTADRSRKLSLRRVEEEIPEHLHPASELPTVKEHRGGGLGWVHALIHTSLEAAPGILAAAAAATAAEAPTVCAVLAHRAGHPIVPGLLRQLPRELPHLQQHSGGTMASGSPCTLRKAAGKARGAMAHSRGSLQRSVAARQRRQRAGGLPCWGWPGT
jgi:hypothetical protein